MSKSEIQVLDFEKICRLCLLEKRSMSAIFSKRKSDKKVPLPERIMSCASLQLYEGDGLPSSICNKCLMSVNQSYAFREQCEQADTTLRQYAQRLAEANEEASTNREVGECTENDSLDVENNITEGDAGVEMVETLQENDATSAQEDEEETEEEIQIKQEEVDIADAKSVSNKENEEMKVSDEINLKEEEDDTNDAEMPEGKIETNPKIMEISYFGNENLEKKNEEDQENMELLKNLIKNKSIMIKRRKIVSEKPHHSENPPVVKKVFIENAGRIASLWKEWDEAQKKVPKLNIRKKSDLESSFEQLCNFVAKKPDIDDGRRKPITPEVVFKGNGEEEEEDSKTKWKNGKDTVYCKECRIFMLRSSYHNHVKFVHEKVRKYLCQTCGYAACTGTILRQHVQAVHVGYSYFCDKCPKKFNLEKRLKKHIDTYHSGKPIEKKHICQYCAMAFAKPGCLKRHLRSHTQETPYQCQYCQRRFKYRWPKVQHERLHTGEKPYKCSFCDERFTQNCVRKTHEYKKHGNEEFKPKERIRTAPIRRKVSKKKEKDEEETEAEEGSSGHSESESNS